MKTKFLDAGYRPEHLAVVRTPLEDGRIEEFAFPKARLKQLRDSLAPMSTICSPTRDRTPIADDGVAMNFLISQLAFVEVGQLEKDVIEAQYSQLLPVKRGQGMHLNQIRYETIEKVGFAREMGRSSDVVPNVDVTIGQKTMDVTGPVAIGYSYNVVELAESAFLQRPLDATRANACREAAEYFNNLVALFGKQPTDPTASSVLTGPTLYPSLLGGYLDSNLSVTPLTLVKGTGGIVGDWGGNGATVSTTTNQILADINQLCIQFNKATAYKRWPTKILLPTTVYDPLSYPMNTAAAVSALTYIQNECVASKNGAKPNFVRVPGLDNVELFDTSKSADGGHKGYRRIVAINDRDMSFNITQDLMFLAPQLEGLWVRVPGFSRCTRGVIFRRQNDIAFLDNV